MDSHCLLVVCSGGSREGDRGTMTMLDAPRAEFFFKFSLQPPPPPIISVSGSASMTWKALSGRSRS